MENAAAAEPSRRIKVPVEPPETSGPAWPQCPEQQHRHPAGLAGKSFAQESFERLIEFKWKCLERR